MEFESNRQYRESSYRVAENTSIRVRPQIFRINNLMNLTPKYCRSGIDFLYATYYIRLIFFGTRSSNRKAILSKTVEEVRSLSGFARCKGRFLISILLFIPKKQFFPLSFGSQNISLSTRIDSQGAAIDGPSPFSCGRRGYVLMKRAGSSRASVKVAFADKKLS